MLSEQTLITASRRADVVGLGADRVLVRAGMLDEELYVRALADALGVEFELLEAKQRELCPFDDRELLTGPAAGALPLIVDRDVRIVIAPQGNGARNLTDFLAHYPHLARRFRLTTSERLQAFVSRCGEAAVAEYATSKLAKTWPEMSAAPRARLTFPPLLGAIACALGAAFIVAPEFAMFGCDIALSVVFLAWAAIRMVAAIIEPLANPPASRLRDCDLPIYSVLVPLYREAASVKGLVSALRRLDYPPEKLDITLIVERDDRDTITAIRRQQLDPRFHVIVAPVGNPQTKPKALNAALPFVRGSFVVIYDAEDRPDPAQLRLALNAFSSYNERLACVQAGLTIDNCADNWLTAMFTAEYAAQFDVFLPALTKLTAPLPLGGSSNHFRTAALRAVGGWDPYNVTEDADLGLRLARFGHRTIAVSSSTYEEAPPQLGAWLRQRTRWFKGWMQTWLVHNRAPVRLLRELGLFRFAVVQLMVGGHVLASLVHPLMLFWLLCAALLPEPMFGSGPVATLFTSTIAAGYIASALLGGLGLYRRDLLKHSWVLLLLPLHWLLLAAASWRALAQLFRDPYRWEKTEHGLARTSRMGVHENSSNARMTLRKAASPTRP